jgi:HAD superfamily hydrolase (TIGR01549 family)
MSCYDAVGFDLDGVLINSLAVMEEAWGEVRVTCDVTVSFQEYSAFIGHPFEVIIKNLGLLDKLELIKQVYFHATNKYSRTIKTYPGLYQVIDLLKKNCIPVFIVTSKPRRSVEAIISSLNIEISQIVCPDDVMRGKPFNESAELVKKKLSLQNKKIIFVGDMMVDLEFSKNSNFDFCYASYGYGNIDERTLSSHKKINNLIDLLDLLSIPIIN